MSDLGSVAMLLPQNTSQLSDPTVSYVKVSHEDGPDLCRRMSVFAPMMVWKERAVPPLDPRPPQGDP